MGVLHNSGAYPAGAEDHARLREYAAKCLEASRRNPHENRVSAWLNKSGLKWGRQKSLGWRIADFWNHKLGVIVEVDGATHVKRDDEIADAIHAKRSAILVFRVKNKATDSDLTLLLCQIASVKPWNERRAEVRLKPVRMAEEKAAL